MKKLLLGVILLPLLFSCNKFENEYKIFTVKKGENRSVNTIRLINDCKIEFEAIFNHTAKYKTRLPENQMDTQKLIGFSDCGNFHHVNSARVGFRWTGEKLELKTYTYTNKKRDYKTIKSIPLDTPIRGLITRKGDKYHFWVDGVHVEMEANDCKCQGYTLWLYYGDKALGEYAPHDISLQIKILD